MNVKQLFDLQRARGARHRRLARARPADGRGARRDGRAARAHRAQEGRAGRGGGAPASSRASRPRPGSATSASASDRAGARADPRQARPRGHPGEQRRRHLGRARGGSPARGLGQAGQPQPDRRASSWRSWLAKKVDDPGEVGPHHQHRLGRRRAGERPARGAHGRLQRHQARRGRPHPAARRRMGRARHHGERHLPGLLPLEDDQGDARHRPASWCSKRRRPGASATTRT